jgi:hypothetical protein
MSGADRMTMNFVQDEKGLKIIPGKTVSPLTGIVEHSLAWGFRVSHITEDKD